MKAKQPLPIPFAKLEAEYNQRRLQLNAARQQRDVVARTLETIDQRIAAIEQGKPVPQVAMPENVGKEKGKGKGKGVKTPTVYPKRGPYKRPAARNEVPMNVRVDAIMSDGQERSTRDIARKLLDSGYKTTSDFEKFCQSVSSALCSNDSFVRVSKGVYKMRPTKNLAPPEQSEVFIPGSISPETL